MSVILDSLRRARGAPAVAPETSGHPPQKPVPEQLRAGHTPQTSDSPRLRPSVLIGIGAVAIGIWAVVQLSLGLMAPERVSTPTPDLTIVDRGRAPVPDGPPAPASPPSMQGARLAEDPVIPTPQERAKPAASAPSSTPARQPSSRRPGPSPRAAVSGTAQPVPIVQPPLPVSKAPVAADSAEPPMQGRFDLAVKYHAAGNFEQAIVQYLALLEREPFNLQARNNLGMLYRDRGARDEAIRQLQLAVKGDPQYLPARQNLGVVYLEAGRLIEARVELNAALRVEPRNVDTLVNLALVDIASGRAEVAKETLTRALATDAGHALAHYNLALIYEQGGELARAHHHYSEFLSHAEPGFTTEIVNVQAKVDQLSATLFPTRRP